MTRTATGLNACRYTGVGRYEWPLRPDGRHELYLGTQDNWFLASLDDGRTWGDGGPDSNKRGDYLAASEGFHDSFERDHETAIDSRSTSVTLGSASRVPR